MRTTRREALAGAGLAAAALLAGCGGGAGSAGPGSTLRRTLADPDGDGLLSIGPGVPLADRIELAPRAAATAAAPLATLAQLTDLHVRDAQSPGRVAFLDRLGPRLGSAFRWHETLSTQVVAAAVTSVNAARPDAVLVTGDLIDSAQRNELAWALTLLRGGTLRPNSGGPRYEGVQAAAIADPLYYRPDVDAPRHPGLLDRAVAPVRSPGLHAPWYPALGNHDILVAGELSPSAATRDAATGDRLVVTPAPSLLRALRGARLTRAEVDALLQAGVAGDALTVTPDAARTQLDAPWIAGRLRAGGGRGLDYVADVGDALRVVVLDLARRDQGADGLVTATTLAFVRRALAEAGDRWVIVVSHQPLAASTGGASVLDLLDADPRVVATLAGHTHRNAIAPRHTRAGGFWQMTTASIVDWPQQWRALQLVETAGRGLALETWLVDHDGRPGDEASLAGIARDLAFLDPQGGRPAHAAGPAAARNVRLHLPPRDPRPPRRPGTARPLPPAVPPTTLGAGDSLV